MTADPFMERVQARVVDLAEQSWRDARLAETEAAKPKPDFTSRTDSSGVAWPENFSYYSASGEWRMLVDWHPPVLLPTPEQYADAERLLRSRGPLDADAARLRCWITDTRPLAVKAGWNDDEDLDLDDYTTITDSRILADLASRAPRPSLWTRTPEWAWLVLGALSLALGILAGMFL